MEPTKAAMGIAHAATTVETVSLPITPLDGLSPLSSGSSQPRAPQIQSCARTEKRVCSVSSRLTKLLAAKKALGINRGAVSHALRLCDDAGGAPSTVQQRRLGRLAGARKRSLVSCSLLGLD
jgi:hypothetical protein